MTDAQGRGLDEVEVSVYRNVGGSWAWVKDVATDADGLYDVPVIAGEYRLSFTEYDNRLREWWNDAETLATATSVVVAAGADRTGINAQLADGGVVTGTVTYPQQVTGWRSTVTLFDATTGAWAGQAAVDAHQNRYRIEDLPSGTYRAQFSRTSGFDTAEGQFWNGRTENQGPGTQTFAVTEGATTPDVNATLVDGGILTGLVQNGQGNPLEGCKVSAYTLDGALVTRESRYTGADGTFRVRGLTTGSYRLRVFDGECGFTTRYYDGAGQTSTTAANAVAVAATRATSTAVPQPLVVPTGAPVANTALPTVTGTPEVGRTLTAGTGTLEPVRRPVVRLPVARRRRPDRGRGVADVRRCRRATRARGSRCGSPRRGRTPPTASRPRPRPRRSPAAQPPITNNGVPIDQRHDAGGGPGADLDPRHLVAAERRPHVRPAVDGRRRGHPGGDGCRLHRAAGRPGQGAPAPGDGEPHRVHARYGDLGRHLSGHARHDHQQRAARPSATPPRTWGRR